MYSTPQKPSLTRSKRLLQNHDTLAQWIQHSLNLVVVGVTLIILALWRDGTMGDHYRVMLGFSLLIMTIIYNWFGVFRRFENLFGGMQHLARAWGTVIIILAWLAFLTKTSEAYSRQVIVYWVFIAYILQVAVLYLTHTIHAVYRTRYRARMPAIIIGTGSMAKHLAQSISNNTWLNDKIVGVIGDQQAQEHWNDSDIPLLGTESDICALIDQYAIKRVYMALPLADSNRIQDIQNTLFEYNIDLIWAPDIFSLHLLNHSVREAGGVPLINLNETPLRAGGPAFIKDCMDKTIALCAIIALSPLLIAAALAVKLSSKGPIIFKQVRDGWDGKKFYVFKFRSMYQHQAKGIIEQAKRSDSRITPVGRFLRRSSIDELPQLFNVLNGSMSLVGPRPHAESHNQYYSDKVNAYLARHRIKPGITGLAQINGCRGETEDIKDMARRVEYDLAYIANWSPLLDIQILIATPMRLISKVGNAY
ncbi:undecaprenyl-phosphate glucose phosphotransferase [Marinagarivorans algicola]|uniref:undecaprenyl-phosphate glucose phosphotransferase n=1 Tax=Marinagarivorans algicola TaxID=1513270 RepID=UPI0006B49BE3|nr:undecaprenyl-phosphate glucose phosphotransferase [Marinagarivorans algicola]